MEFKASLDTTAKIVTAAIALLFFGLAGIGIVKHNETASIIYATAIPVFVLIGCWLYHPTAFALTEDHIIIRRPIGDKSFKRSDMTLMAVPQTGYISGIRTFGVGGVFGYFGQFYNTSIGHMTWYVTHRDHVIAITFKTGKKIIISPDDAAGFIKAFGNM